MAVFPHCIICDTRIRLALAQMQLAAMMLPIHLLAPPT